MNPDITVIIPAYNKAPFLSEAIESVVQQTYKNFEIIVINDGSTDTTEAVAKALQSRWPQIPITLLTKINGGVSDARNFGIEKSRGQFITCLDADDMMAPTYLASAIDALKNSDANLVTCNVELFGDKTSEWIPSEYTVYSQRYHNLIPTLVTYKKNIWEAVGGYKKAFPFNEDWDFFVSAELANLTVTKIPEKLFRYRVTTGGLAEQYIKDTWEHSFSLVVTSNESRYGCDRVFTAQRTLLSMPERWYQRFIQQDVLHPDEWLLKFWLAIAAQGRGLQEEAKGLYALAVKLSNSQNWQPIFHLAELFAQEGNTVVANHLYLQVRILRPDTERIIEGKIK